MGREMGKGFKRERSYVYLWLIHVEVWQKTTIFCKAIILQLKNKKRLKIFLKKKKKDCQEKYQWPQICRWYHSNDRKWRGTKESLDEGKGGEGKSLLKTQFKNTKIMASSPITLWQMEGERWKQWQISSFGALKSLRMVTAATKLEDDCFLAGKLWQTYTVCLKAKTFFCQQMSL